MNANGSGRKSQAPRLLLPRAALRRCQVAGIYCQPAVSIEYQRIAKRYILRGVESGGSARGVGHYVAFCGPRGEALPWLHQVQSIAGNGLHAIVLAHELVGAEMFRTEQTYDLLIVHHRLVASETHGRPKLISAVVFRGKQGHLSLELWGKDKAAAGKITPEFFTRSGERNEVPTDFVGIVQAVTKGVTSLSCRAAVYACPFSAEGICGVPEQSSSNRMPQLHERRP
jgi:hypothetical protein